MHEPVNVPFALSFLPSSWFQKIKTKVSYELSHIIKKHSRNIACFLNELIATLMLVYPSVVEIKRFYSFVCACVCHVKKKALNVSVSFSYPHSHRVFL